MLGNERPIRNVLLVLVGFLGSDSAGCSPMKSTHLLTHNPNYIHNTVSFYNPIPYHNPNSSHKLEPFRVGMESVELDEITEVIWMDIDTFGRISDTSKYHGYTYPINKLWLPTLRVPKIWTDSIADFWVDSLSRRWSYESAITLRDSASMLPDSTHYFYDSAGVKYNAQQIRPIKDPFDPFLNTLYIRKGQAKFWFVGVALVFLLLFYYYRSAFVKQFDLRIKGVVSSYFFDEMMNDKSFEYQGGSAVVLLLGNLVFSLGIMLYLRFGGFLALNAGWFYWVVFGAVVVGVIVLQFIQFVFAYALDMTETIRRQNQRQLNTNFMLALIFLPVFVFVYYNANLLKDIDIPSLVSFMLIVWIVARSILSFVGLSKDRQLDFTAFLYFCTLEVLPYALFFSLLSKT